MRQFERNFLIGVTAYVLAAIVTFGHAACLRVAIEARGGRIVWKGE